MKSVFVALVMLTSFNSFAAMTCIDFTGKYALENACIESTYSGSGMLFPLNGTHGLVELGGVLKIKQETCQTITLGHEVVGANNRTYNIERTFVNGVDSNAVSIDAASAILTFENLKIPTSLYNGQVVILKTQDGIEMDYTSYSWSVPFDLGGTSTSNRCALTRL
jgi:hypothetical protein